MFKCGQQVVYGSHGVCQILQMETKNVDRKKVEYYVLEPMDQPDARFYVPAHNEAALAKLRPILSKQELDDLLVSEDADRNAWINDENQRKQRYRELITSGDRAALISMVRSLYQHKLAQQAAGRKFHLCDENFMRDAEKLLSSEFSLVLGIPASDVGSYIESKLGK